MLAEFHIRVSPFLPPYFKRKEPHDGGSDGLEQIRCVCPLVQSSRVPATFAIQTDAESLGDKFPCELKSYYFNNCNIVSGDTCIFVTAHMPTPISFTLAPSR